MKKLMPFIAAGAILLGSACNTYTATTDPATLASGWSMNSGQKVTDNVTGRAINDATFDNNTITSNRDSLTNIQPDSALLAPRPAVTPDSAQKKVMMPVQ